MTGSFECVVEVANVESAEADPWRAAGVPGPAGPRGGADLAEQLCGPRT
ncbi:hypothetical protein ACWGF2_31490 [Streptomyces sp. NPDC054919]